MRKVNLMKRLSLILLFLILMLSLRAQNAVDVHTHNIIPEIKAYLDRYGASLDETFPLPDWDEQAHLNFMKEAGIEKSFLSMPAPQPIFGTPEENRKMVRLYNTQTAKLCKRYPDKFGFFAALPLPNVDAAIEEAVYALDTLKAAGVKLATNSGGQYLGDKELDRLMKVLDERNAIIVIHPHKPVPVNDSLITPLAMYEYVAETTRAVVNMLSRNVPATYSNLRFVIPHCGSFLPLALPRMKSVLPAMVAKNLMQAIDWEGNLKNFYYDLAGNPSAEVIDELLTITTPEHLLYGSDYPYMPESVLANNLANLRKTLTGNPFLASYANDMLRQNAASRLLEKENGPESLTTQTTQISKEPMQADGIIRLSKVEVYPEYLEEYMKMAAEVGTVSLRTEPGVLTMYAVSERENPHMITILETYSSQEAYKRHISSEHFQKYKQGTLHMVKNLQLTDQNPLNPDSAIYNYIR